MRNENHNSISSSLILSNFIKLAGVAYLLATLLLCCALLFSYFTLKRILVEQETLHAFHNATGELWSAIQDSSIYLIDLKEAKKKEQGESLLVKKINRHLKISLKSIKSAKESTESYLLAIDKYPYSQTFNEPFNKPPYSIWLKLEQYVARLEYISSNDSTSLTAIESLWLPVEATAAKSGTLAKSYVAVLKELNVIISAKSAELRETHFILTLFSVGIALLELLLIFLPLQHYLVRSTYRLRSAHKKLDALVHFDNDTKLHNLSGMARQLSIRNESFRFDDLTIASITNHEDIAQVVGPENMPEFHKLVARRLNQLMPFDAILFRAGEYQFGVLTTQSSTAEMQRAWSDINQQLASKLQVAHLSVYPEFRCGRCDGGIQSNNLADKTRDAIIASNYYDVKSDSIPLFILDMRNSIEAKNNMVEEIRAAIVNKEFVPFYQCKVDSKTTKITGMEALCRWVRPDNSMVYPDEFIDIAEQSGLMVEITWNLLQQIVVDYRKWIAAGLNPGRIAFNASESMLLEIDFKERINILVGNFEYSFCPLDMEITESVALTNKAETISEAISYARKQGIKIALDDFGTGFASISTITTLEIDAIKIDKSFVSGLGTNEDSRNIVAFIIQLCKQMNKKCVVEGVETKEEWRFCSELACDEIQGYYFYKPTNAQTVTDSLKAEQQWREAG